MAYDLEEQEQLANLKAVWKQYGNIATWALIAGLGSYAGWSYWNSFQQSKSSEASVLFEELNKAAAGKDDKQVQRVTSDLKERFPSSHYVEMSVLIAAKSAYDSGDFKHAKELLSSIVGTTKNEEYRALAKIRLSGILLDEKSFDDAAKLINSDFPEEFLADQADRRGDILVAQGKVEEARKSYQTALEKMKDKSAGKPLVQIKLDAIGGTTDKS